MQSSAEIAGTGCGTGRTRYNRCTKQKTTVDGERMTQVYQCTCTALPCDIHIITIPHAIKTNTMLCEVILV